MPLENPWKRKKVVLENPGFFLNYEGVWTLAYAVVGVFIEKNSREMD